MTTLILFEDHRATHLQPLTLTRPVHDLRTGLLTIREKWERALGLSAAGGPATGHWNRLFHFKQQTSISGAGLWINARYLPTPELVVAIEQALSGHLRCGDDLVAVRSDPTQTAAWLAGGHPMPTDPAHDVDPAIAPSIRYPWDLFLAAPREIAADIAALGWPAGRGAGVSETAIIDHPERVFIHPTAVVEPGAILVAEAGPILLAAESRVMAGAILRGPVAVGEAASVQMAARISAGTCIGPRCKVGGEVASSIFHSYSNKAHDGYVGNSVFGQWVNLGAGTTASNLKVTYGGVAMWDWPTGETVDSGQQFLGVIMADHSKTAINTKLNTGTVCGVHSVVAADGFPPRRIPSFTWVLPGGQAVYRLDEAVVAMERMMARRSVALEPAYREMMEAIFQAERG